MPKFCTVLGVTRKEVDATALRAWGRVGVKVKERRDELGWSQRDAGLAAPGALSEATWASIEDGDGWKSYTRTLRKVCIALRWTEDSIDRIVAGGEPEVKGPAVGRHESDASFIEARVAYLEAQVAELKRGNRQ